MELATPAPPSQQSSASLPPAGTVEQLAPSQISVVDVEHARTGEVVRRDCYDPAGTNAKDLEGARKVFGLQNREIYVRAIDWARSRSMDAVVGLRWIPTGMRVEEVDRIRVFTWPDATLTQVFRHMA